MSLMLHAGLRATEVLALPVSDVDGLSGRRTVRASWACQPQSRF